MDQRHAIDGALLDQPVDDAIVDIGEMPALCTCDARQSEDKTNWIGNGEIAGIMDQFIDTIGLRRMIGEMPPQIMIAIEPARACDPMDECGDDPPLRLFLTTWPRWSTSWRRADSELLPAHQGISCRPLQELRLPQGAAMTALWEPRWQRRMWPVPLRQFAHSAPLRQSIKFSQRCGPQEGRLSTRVPAAH
jgi:hypothetical protein